LGLVALPVADLVDPDPAQAGEQIAVGSRFTGDALLGCSTRSPDLHDDDPRLGRSRNPRLPL
jgi:hypothetical protein